MDDIDLEREKFTTAINNIACETDLSKRKIMCVVLHRLNDELRDAKRDLRWSLDRESKTRNELRAIMGVGELENHGTEYYNEMLWLMEKVRAMAAALAVHRARAAARELEAKIASSLESRVSELERKVREQERGPNGDV